MAPPPKSTRSSASESCKSQAAVCQRSRCGPSKALTLAHEDVTDEYNSECVPCSARQDHHGAPLVILRVEGLSNKHNASSAWVKPRMQVHRFIVGWGVPIKSLMTTLADSLQVWPQDNKLPPNTGTLQRQTRMPNSWDQGSGRWLGRTAEV